jgi:outer membrane protein
MKNILKLFVVLLVATFSMNVQAQAGLKIGYLDFQELITLMPGQEEINKKLDEHVSGLQSQLQAMQSEYETKVNDYQAGQATMSDIIKQTKEKEITDLQQRIEAFNQQAQVDIQNKQIELTQPLIDKAKKAIEDVAKENGFTYIINGNEQILLYKSGTDILPLVKKKLGL